ncbi:restriction endonuclease PLD domain-containing protein [Flavobacterium glaciei]|jgi:HKD family nuclease|uniref:NgoFVII restriction endonuclease n=1 Tax=Flavobacterium glaciei TaxID=386300 RepID=A0A562PR77_9FLAO|nr:restriction endonuclease PLD domain-containing protein [Flavobacterium glaciei]RDI53661.1 NgoFVII restriction endonuclease [Flavobacterium glaciei]TWI46888.1 NgoFVII restriction endonuclease [Flavobacterium glaciei]
MIITNHKESHKEKLIELFKEADEVIFAAGFLKNSGLNNIKDHLKDFCNDKTKKSTFFIGTGLGETDPKTLENLNNIIKTKVNHRLILCTPDAGIFHSKIYVFRKGNNATIIIGSANLTEAGWIVNDEVSMIKETFINSTEYLQLMQYFSRLTKAYYTENIAELIAKYKSQLEEFNQEYSRKPIFKFKRKKTTIAGIDMPRLRHYFEVYKKSSVYIIPLDREKQYDLAKENLEILASNKHLNANQFHNLFGPLVGHSGYKKLWHSGSIHRTTHETLDYANAFRELVRKVKDNSNQAIDVAFTNSINFLNTKRKAKEIFGIGENIVAEIMMSYNYNKFPNLNKNPLTVLSLIGKDFKTVGSFKGTDYQEYTVLLNKIKTELNMNSFLEIDSFFNYVYWNMEEE